MAKVCSSVAGLNLGLDNRDGSFALTNTNLAGVRVTIPSTGAFGFTDSAGDFNIGHSGTIPVTINVSFANALRISAVNSSTGLPAEPTLALTPTAIPGTPVNVQIYTSTAVATRRSQTNCYYFTHSVNEYCRGIIGSLPAATDLIAATVNSPSSCGAFYTGNTITFSAAGSGCVNTAYITVVPHEWGHGLDDRYGGISQIDGLSEGWGDVLATYHSGQPIVGPNFLNTGAFVRTALNTRTFPAGGGVHQQGETWMGFAWDLRLNLIALCGSEPGIALAERIVIGAIVANPSNQPNALREVFLLDDNDGNLATGTPHCMAIRDAANGRTIPLPSGVNCAGYQGFVSPVANAAVEGNVGSAFPFNSISPALSRRYMQVHSDLIGNPTIISQLAWRQNGPGGVFSGTRFVTLTAYMGDTVNWDKASHVFANNYLSARTLVANGSFVLGPTPTSGNPAPFQIILPLATPWCYAGTGSFAWDVEVSNNVLTGIFPAANDAASGSITTSGITNTGVSCTASGQTQPMLLSLSHSDVTGTYTFGAYVDHGPANAATWLLIGATNPAIVGPPLHCGWRYTNWPGLPSFALPMKPTNALGFSGVTSGGGATKLPGGQNVWSVANTFAGGTLYFQALSIDPGQPFGFLPIAFSNGLSGVVPVPNLATTVAVTRLFNNDGGAAATEAIYFNSETKGYGLVTRFR